MFNRNDRKAHKETLGRLCRRGVASVLAFALSLSLLPVSVLAATTSPIIQPTQITEETQSQVPKIEFQTNFVRTEYGSLTGMMELAIRVGPSETTTDATGKELPIPVNFQAIAATLQFNAELFHPVNWSWEIPEDKDEALPAFLPLNAQNYYDVHFPAMKDDTIPGTGAIAQCGVVSGDAANGMTEAVANGNQALLFFKAESYGAAVTLTEMTTLAVVRFYVDPALMKHIFITRLKNSVGPDGGYDYAVWFDTFGDGENSAISLKARDDLNGAILDAVNEAGDPLATKIDLTEYTGDDATNFFTAVGFAVDSDMASSDSPAGMSLDYSTGSNEFYFVPDYDAAKGDNAEDNDTLTNRTIYVDDDGKVTTRPVSGKNTTPIPLIAPVTEGDCVLAVDPNKGIKDPTRYSYLSNLIPAENVTFPVVSQLSFADRGDGRENMATVLFYDWDDTLIGVLVVPRNDDARALVNAYVRDNMIHPDLRFDEENRNGSTVEALVNSLSRSNSYRGKYPSTPMPEDGKDNTMDGNRPNDEYVGSDYPLTNKLDYVFLKRPMEQVKDVTTNTWKQLGDETEAVWDYEYPYIYGWALIPDKDLTDIQYTHPKNIWTTMGTTGELNSYTGIETIRIPGVGVQKNVISANVTSTDPDFQFADFNFSKASLQRGSVYAVKAVYEPGIDLMGDVSYRMISQPYYDKLNSNQAAGGGAYSVDILFERSNINEDILYGVTRARSLMLRQETTSDIRWEGEDLVNATTVEQDRKTKTTYTNVAVENIDIVEIQLVLSARQNKVDYYLMEGYGASFVTGGERSSANSTYFDNDHTWDSYNYRVDDSELGDIYYDTPYGERDGSRGFVLYGTLNSIFRITSQYILGGEQDDADFNVYVTEDTLRDINLRYPNNSFVTLDGDEEALERYLKMIEAIQAAVRSAVVAHNAGNDTWWNKDPDRNWADMTYHQLQHFVIDYIQNGGSATLMREIDAEAKSISWCHYHEECAAKASGKPRNWAELVRTAQGFDANNKPVDSREKITLLTLEEIEAIAHIRADDKGSAFADNGAFADAFVLAVRNGNTTWDTIQDYIIRKQADAEWSQKNYWWYDGATRISFDSLTDTVAAARDAYTPAMAPGDSTGVIRTAKINQLKKIFEENQSSTTVTSDWNNATKNLCDGNEGDKFRDFEDFRDKFVLAAEAVVGAVGVLEFDATDTLVTMAAKTRAYWDKLQYHILNGSYAASHPDMETYWWYDGNSKIGDLASLLAAAQRQVELDNKGNGEIDTIFNLFSLADLYTLTDLHFRSNFHGDGYTNIGAFKDAVKEYVKLGSNVVTIVESNSTSAQKTNCWNQLQYYLIHRGDTGFDAGDIRTGANSERTYYWWRNGADGEEYAFGKTSSKDPGPDDVWTLMEAVYRYEINGNRKAYDQLTPELMAGFRLVSSYTTEETWNDLPKYEEADIGGLKTTLKALYDAGVLAGDDYKTVTWRQVQHYLLGKGYVTKDQLAGDDSLIPSENKGDKEGYWWKEGQEKPKGDGPPPSALDYFLAEIDKAIDKAIQSGGDIDESILNDAVDNYVLNDALGLHGGTVSKTGHKVMSAISTMQKSTFKKKIIALAKTIKKSSTTCVGILDWYVLQYYAINANAYSEGDPIKDHDFAKDYYTNTLVVKCQADWVPEEYKNSGEASGASVMSLMMAMRPDTMVETDPDTGIVTVTTVVEEYLEEIEMVLVVTTAVAIDPVAGTTTTTVITTLMDWEGNILSETTTTDVAPIAPEEPEEPVCTCGSEDETHAEDCPLYEAPAEPEEPICTCGSEDETHAEDCPLYEAPAEPEEPVCTCGSEDETHAEGCPLYEAPEEPAEPTETPEPTESPEPEPTETPEPEESPEPTESQKPEGSWESQSEIIGRPDEEPEEPEKGEPDPAPTPEEPESSNEESELDIPEGLPDIEALGGGTVVTVIETPPPLGVTPKVQSRSATMDYKKLTTKITILRRRPATGQTKLLARAGGVKMKQLNIRRIISPPGYGRVPLLLRTELMERRRAL